MFHWHFPLQLPPPPKPTWISCFTSVCYGIYCLRENVFCHQWVEKVFTPVVHLLMILNIINSVSYKTPVKMSLGTKMPIYFLAFCTFHFLLYSLSSFLHQFNLQLFLSLIAWEFLTCCLILHRVLLTVFTQMQSDSNLRQPPKNKSLLRKNILLLISYT